MSFNQLTPCEAEVMAIVWNQNITTIQEVVDKLSRPLAYTTVMTTLKILEEKGFVQRIGKRGRAFEYSPIVSKESVRQSMVSQLAARLFDGSMKSLVLSMLGNQRLTREELHEVQAAIASLEEST